LFAHRPWQTAKGGIELNAEGEFAATAETEDTGGEED
jgi:hypothetical protein